jgi:hypothetical protein
VQGAYNNGASAIHGAGRGEYRGIPGLGYHYLAWCEKGGDNTSTFLGDNGADGVQSGLYVTVMA